MAKSPPKADSPDSKRPVGTLVAYSRAGVEFYRKANFRAGSDIIPFGVSMGAGATMIVSDDGEVLSRWDPWNVLSGSVVEG